MRGFEIDRSVDDGAERLNFWLRRDLQYGQSRAETYGRRRFRAGEQFFQFHRGKRRELGCLLMPNQSLFANGKFHLARERGNASAPVADRVAVDADGVGGLSDGVAFGEQCQNVMLIRGEGGIGRIIGEFGRLHGDAPFGREHS